MLNEIKKRPVYSAKSISKEFVGVKALKDVSFDLYPGEVHVLVGENGAGKSTLMKILTGIYSPTAGVIELDSKPICFRSAKEAEKNGIAIIHQELNLCDDLTAADNIFLTREYMAWGVIDRKKNISNADIILGELHANFNANTKVKNLSVSQKQLIEIAKAISLSANIIIMDEPTSSIGEEEVKHLFHIIDTLKSHGKAIVYISHKLNELDKIADRVTVIRDGELILTDLYCNLSVDQIISAMVGRELSDFYPKLPCNRGSEVLSVHAISANLHGVKNASFDLYKGEILGFAGLIGSGRTEIAKCIIGDIKIDNGYIKLKNKMIKLNSILNSMQNGIVYLPEDRKKEGLFLNSSVSFNIIISTIKNILVSKYFPMINNKKSISISDQMVQDLKVRTPSSSQKIIFLSGGNQQKVILAKLLLIQPDILILDEPTRGIDINSKVEIYNILNELKQKGVGIILISSELPEIIGMSDRVIVVKEGKTLVSLENDNITQENIMKYATV